MMTNRERILALLSGKIPDRLPWIPRLLLWYNARQLEGTLPPRYRNWKLRDIEKDLGMGTPARDGRVFRTAVRGVEVTTKSRNGMEAATEYRTPAGTVQTLTRGSQLLRSKGIMDLEVEHIIKRPEDYAVAEYLVEHTEYTPCYDEYLAYEGEIGDDGYPLVAVGDCPFHHWLKNLVGYNQGYYHLNDTSEKVERLLNLMTQKDREVLWPIVAKSPAKLFLHGLHFDSDMTPPPIYERYIRPYYQEFTDLLHRHGKYLCMHADADSRRILAQIRDSGFDMAETFTTEPMVTCTLAEARKVFGRRVVVWGGVPSVILENAYSDEYFESYMEKVFRTIAPGDAFMLGVADNVMPDAKIERLARITEMVEEWGAYPVRLPDRVPAGS